MICQPCQTTGHVDGHCDDAHRDHAAYRSCACQHRLSPVSAPATASRTTRNRTEPEGKK